MSSENGFTIVDGVLARYSGTDRDVIVPDGVSEIGSLVFHENFSDFDPMEEFALDW